MTQRGNLPYLGFPYPENADLAAEAEAVVRSHGAVPATIGVLDGVQRVGMTKQEMERLASLASEATKLSRRDLACIGGRTILGQKLHGGTTIAGTMVLAHLAGIKVFATGGLGGVHRGATSSMDISADLTELGRTPIAVISSGCKAFLDIPRTLEYLETEGVGVATFADGRQGNVDFPAFWSRGSGVKSPTVVADEKEAAAIIRKCERTSRSQLDTNDVLDALGLLRLSSGLFFANPIPIEAEIAYVKIKSIIDDAVRDAELNGISGKDNTPFILQKIKDLTKGESVVANRALFLNNVRVGSLVAQEVARLQQEQKPSPATKVSNGGAAA